MRLGNVAIFGRSCSACCGWRRSRLSPADMQKNAGKKTQKWLLYKANNRRDLDGEEDLSEEQNKGIAAAQATERCLSALHVTIPMDISVKMMLEQFQKQKATIQDFLHTLFSPGQSQDTQEESGQSDDQ